MELAAVAALLAAGLGKIGAARAVEALALGDDALLRSVLLDSSAILAGASKDPIERWLVGLDVHERTRQRLLASGTWIDLCAIAWAQALAEHADDDLQAAFGVPARQARRILHLDWFLEAVMTSLPGLAVVEPREELPGPAVDALVEALATECAWALVQEPDGEDAPLRSFLQGVVAELPRRIGGLFLSLPGMDARLARIASEGNRDRLDRVLALIDGTDAAQEALRALEAEAQRIAALADADVFARLRFDPLPKLPQRAAYVEPDGVWRDERTAVKAQIRRA